MGKLGKNYPTSEAVEAALNRANKAEADIAELQDTVNIKADKTETLNLQSQINQIVIASAEEYEVAPEVAAARVTEDGMEYQTLKERLDTAEDKQSHKFDTITNKTKNLFTETFEPFSNLNNSTGAYSVSGSNLNTVATRDYITVMDGKTYYFSSPDERATGAIYTFFWYDSSKQFLSSSSSGVVPSNAAFARVKINKTNSTEALAAIEKWQLETDGMTDYVPPYEIETDAIADNSVSSAKIQDRAVTPPKTSFVSSTINIFDYTSLEAGYAINQSTGKVVQAQSNYISTLSFISVEPSTPYTITKFAEDVVPYGFIYEYDDTYTYIGRTNVVDGDTITMGSTTYYIRVQEDIREADINTFRYQIEEGFVQHEYVNPQIIDKLLIPTIELDMLSGELREMIVDVPDPLADIKDALDEKRPDIIRRNSAELMNFGFVTDTHLEDVGGNQTGLLDIQTMNQLAAENWLDFVVHGGDVFNSYLTGTSGQGITFDVALKRIDDAMSQFTNVKCPLYVCRGNHDLNVKYMPNYPEDTTVDNTQKITQSQFKLLCQSQFRKDINGEYHCSFYKDFDDKKIRVIVVDTYINDSSSSFTHDSLVFLADALDLGSKNDYSVIMFSHTFERTAKTIVGNLISAFKQGTLFEYSDLHVEKDYSTQGAGDFIACVCGHSHQESYTVEDGYGYITSNTSYLKTNTEIISNIFANVYTIDKSNKILYKQKLGASGQSFAFDWDNLTFTNI